MKKTNIDETKLELAAFTLVLPPEIDVKPTFVVDLPRGRQALIFKHISLEGIHGKELATPVEQYDVYFVHAKSGRSVTVGRYTGARSSFAKMSALRQHLIDIAAELSVKKRVSKSTESVEDDEE